MDDRIYPRVKSRIGTKYQATIPELGSVNSHRSLSPVSSSADARLQRAKYSHSQCHRWRSPNRSRWTLLRSCARRGGCGCARLPDDGAPQGRVSIAGAGSLIVSCRAARCAPWPPQRRRCARLPPVGRNSESRRAAVIGTLPDARCRARRSARDGRWAVCPAAVDHSFDCSAEFRD